MTSVRYNGSLDNFFYRYDIFDRYATGRVSGEESTEDIMQLFAEDFDWSGDNSSI